MRETSENTPNMLENIELRLEKAALAGQLAGVYRSEGNREDGEHFAVVAMRERERVVNTIALLAEGRLDEERETPAGPQEPPLALSSLGKGTKIRVFSAARDEGYAASNIGVVYSRDGAREGYMPWCRTPRLSTLGPYDLLPYLNSREITSWELISE